MLLLKRRHRQCIVTLSIGKNYEPLAKLTIPNMSQYARKVGADFHVIGQSIFSSTNSWVLNVWEKFQIKDMFAAFDKVLFVDLDCYFMRGCPNIFEYYKNDPIVALRCRNIEATQQRLYAINSLPPATVRINSGVMLLERSVAEHIRFPKVQPDKKDAVLSEQEWFAACFETSGLPITNLHPNYNRMSPKGAWIYHACLSKKDSKATAIAKVIEEENNGPSSS